MTYLSLVELDIIHGETISQSSNSKVSSIIWVFYIWLSNYVLSINFLFVKFKAWDIKREIQIPDPWKEERGLLLALTTMDKPLDQIQANSIRF